MANISKNALKLLKEKDYFKENEKTWDDLCDRVSSAIAEAEETDYLKEIVKEEVKDAMLNLEFIFSTPCLINANINKTGQLSSCFVLPIEDNIESIFKCYGQFAKIFQRNGGAGTNLSSLRPKESIVETSGGYSSGVIGFMSGFDWVADEMTKNNKSRKGAVKIDLACWHPDILDFISCKNNTNILQRMNISVAICDDFIYAVDNDLDWNLEFPDYSINKDIYNQEWRGNIYDWKTKGYPTKIYQTIKARYLFDKIATEAWKTGEPGVSYQTTMNNANKNKHIYMEVYGNPCHEFTNVPYSSCNLGSSNLTKFVKDGTFDFDRYKTHIHKAIRWLDNMITINKLPLPEIDIMTKNIRPIGFGTMGLGELFYLLKIPYNSKEAYSFADKLYKFLYQEATNASIQLAKEKGVYPLWEGSEWYKQGIKIRNSNLISIAPNGTIGFLANTSGGAEPVFALTYSRRTSDGTLYYVTNDIFKNELDKLGIYSDELISKIEKNHGSCQGIKEIPKKIQKIFVTAHDISPLDHVEMIGIIQKHVDLSISKCVARGTLIQTNKGVLPIEKLGYATGKDNFGKPIEDLKVRDINGEWKNVVSHYSGGYKNTKIIKFNNGNSIECSENHMLYTCSGWKATKEINIGEYIICKAIDYTTPNNTGLLALSNNFTNYLTNANKLTIPSHMSENFAMWLGMLVSDGHIIESDGCIGITTANDNVERKFIELSSIIFHISNNDINVSYDKRTNSTRKVFITSRNLCRFVKSLIGNNCVDKQIPEQIMCGSRAEQISFINGVTLDGYITNNKLVIYEGYSLTLSRQLFSLCCLFGCKPYFGKKQVKNGRLSKISYSVRVGENIFNPIEMHKQVNLTSKFILPVPDCIKEMKLNTKNLLYNQLRTVRRNNYISIRSDNLLLNNQNVDFSKYMIKVTGIINNTNEVYDIEVEDTHSYLIDNIISHNTANFNNDATIEDVKEIIKYAHSKGCKGLTVYRDGSRENQTLSTDRKINNLENIDINTRGHIIKAPDKAPGITEKFVSGCGNVYLNITYDEYGKINQTFTNKGSSGTCRSNQEAVSRLISLALRGGISVEDIVDQLRSVDVCASYASARKGGKKVSKGSSCPHAISYILEKAQKEIQNMIKPALQELLPEIDDANKTSKCPECKEPIAFEGGCVTCKACGWSRCG